MKAYRRFVLATLLPACWSSALNARNPGATATYADRFLVGASNGEAWECAA
ncbi:MAG: hypothetical protein JNM32_11445 [Dechloromonas sp.]|nr:hypothetical protein [Dechloromonas sp.]